jgi:hypothetical protein
MASVAINVANFASATSTASNASGATLTAAVGTVILVFVAADNNGASGANSTTTCVDSDGVNVYTKVSTVLQDPGAAAAGVVLTIYACKVVQALSNDTFTISFSPNTTAKCAWAWVISPGAGEVVNFWEAGASGNAGSTSTHGAPNKDCPNGFIFFGVAAIESNTAITGDSDTTNGSWVNTTALSANSGSDLTSVEQLVQYKIVTASGVQDWACTTAASKDSARNWVIVSVDTLRGDYLINGYSLDSRLMQPQGLVH